MLQPMGQICPAACVCIVGKLGNFFFLCFELVENQKKNTVLRPMKIIGIDKMYLLENSHAPLFTCCLWVLLQYSVRVK